ncbi:MAG: hypothetical protein ACPL3C_01385 [Pyrobaculum sp.]
MQIVHTYQYSLSKVASHIAEVLNARVYKASELPPEDDTIVVSTALQPDLRSVAGHIVGASRCVAYLVAEGVPRLDKKYVRLVNEHCHVVVPSPYVKSLLEEVGFVVSDVIPHAVRVSQAPPLGRSQVGFIGVNLFRKGADIVLKAASMLPSLSFLMATTQHGQIPLQNIVAPPNLKIITLPPGYEYSFYSSVASLFLPSRAEGFSLAPREFVAATGRLAVVSPLPVYHDEEEGIVKCSAKDEYTVFDGHQFVKYIEADVADCVKKLEEAVRAPPSPSAAEEMRKRYPPELYLKFLQFF